MRGMATALETLGMRIAQLEDEKAALIEENLGLQRALMGEQTAPDDVTALTPAKPRVKRGAPFVLPDDKDDAAATDAAVSE